MATSKNYGKKKGSDHFQDILNPYVEKSNYGKIGRRRRLSKLNVLFFSIILSVTIYIYIYYNICLSLSLCIYIYILNLAHENNLKQITAPTSCWKMGISLQCFFFLMAWESTTSPQWSLDRNLWRWWSPWFWDWIRLDLLFLIPLKMTGFYENPIAKFLAFGTLWLTYSKTPL